MTLTHTSRNSRRKGLGLFKTIKTGFNGRIDIARIILIVIRIFQLTRAKRKASGTHRTNLIGKRLNTVNQIILRGRNTTTPRTTAATGHPNGKPRKIKILKLL